MQSDNNTARLTSQIFVDAMIRLGLIAVLVITCLRIFSPFIAIMLWALVLAVMLYPLHQRFAKRLGGRQGLAATSLVVAGYLLLAVPLFMLSESFVSQMLEWRTSYQNNELNIAQPAPGVAEWPVIGERVYNAWGEAANNLPKFLKEHVEQVEGLSRGILSAAGNAISSLFLFLGALVIAGIMMAFGKSGSDTMQRILSRLAGPDTGPQLHTLSVATIRSVTTGVLGVAFIQAVLFGVGFVLGDVPAAGVLAVVVLFIGIIQLPAVIVAVPVIIYVWAAGDASVTLNIFYSIYFVIAGLADNVLKPLLLGRGVEAPMPVILLGALGGMVGGGFIGLFLGAVVLAVGYQIFMAWVNDPEHLAAAAIPSEPTELAPGAKPAE
jgi:predicted PurR-regulated permease PerM